MVVLVYEWEWGEKEVKMHPWVLFIYTSNIYTS